jgi:hypothetical protein
MGSRATPAKAKTAPATSSGRDTPALCDAEKRSGGTCRRPAGWGTPHVGTGRCKLHGGCTPTHVEAANVLQARAAAQKWGLPVEVGPKEALLDELRTSKGLIAFYAAQVAELEPEQMHGPVGGGQGFPEEKPNIWIVLHRDERKHHAAVAKICHDVGVDEWRMEMAEQAGEWLAAAIRRFCELRGLVLDEPKTQEAVRGALRLLDGGAAG